MYDSDIRKLGENLHIVRIPLSRRQPRDKNIKRNNTSSEIDKVSDTDSNSGTFSPTVGEMDKTGTTLYSLEILENADTQIENRKTKMENGCGIKREKSRRSFRKRKVRREAKLSPSNKDTKEDETDKNEVNLSVDGKYYNRWARLKQSEISLSEFNAMKTYRDRAIRNKKTEPSSWKRENSKSYEDGSVFSMKRENSKLKFSARDKKFPDTRVSGADCLGGNPDKVRGKINKIVISPIKLNLNDVLKTHDELYSQGTFASNVSEKQESVKDETPQMSRESSLDYDEIGRYQNEFKGSAYDNDSKKITDSVLMTNTSHIRFEKSENIPQTYFQYPNANFVLQTSRQPNTVLDSLWDSCTNVLPAKSNVTQSPRNLNINNERLCEILHRCGNRGQRKTDFRYPKTHCLIKEGTGTGMDKGEIENGSRETIMTRKNCKDTPRKIQIQLSKNSPVLGCSDVAIVRFPVRRVQEHLLKLRNRKGMDIESEVDMYSGQIRCVKLQT